MYDKEVALLIRFKPLAIKIKGNEPNKETEAVTAAAAALVLN